MITNGEERRAIHNAIYLDCMVTTRVGRERARGEGDLWRGGGESQRERWKEGDGEKG